MPEKREEKEGNGPQPGRPPALSEDDLEEIQRRLAATDARRRNLSPRLVTIAIDGVERAQLDLTEKREWQIDVGAGASLIEVRGKDDLGDLVLATHLMSYANNAFESSKATAILNKGKLRFQLTPAAVQGQESSRATLSFNYHPARLVSWLAAARRYFASPGEKTRSYALAGLMMTLIVWGLAGIFYARKVKLLEQQLQQAQRNPLQLSPTAARAIVSYALIPDEQRVRGIESAAIPEISLHLHSSAVSLELPVFRTVEFASYSAELKTFAGDRTLVTQSFLNPTRTEAGWAVELVLPADLLRPDTYYTVHLHSPETTEHFTFKVVAGQ